MKSVNERIIAARWPVLLDWLAAAPEIEIESVKDADVPALVAGGIQLWSAYDPCGEAVLLSRTVPPSAERACVYGMSHGELIRTLLGRASIQTLRIVVLNRSVAAGVLSRFDQSDWLADPRIELVRGDALDELEPPFAVAPGEVRLGTDETMRLCDLVQLELRTPHARRHQRALDDRFNRHVAVNLGLLQTDPDVAGLFGSIVGNTVRIAAAGPTLADHFDALRRDTGLLVAVDAALKPLVAAGIRPDVVVSIDGHEEGMRRVFDIDPEIARHIALVYFPAVPNEVLQAWTGLRLAAYGIDSLYDDVALAVPKARLWSSGSVLHPAVDLVVRMGAARVELYGADFANLDGRSHVAGAAWETSVGDKAHRTQVLNGYGRRVPSQPNLVGYLRDLERYIGRHSGVRFYNASREGARIEGTSLLENCHVR